MSDHLSPEIRAAIETDLVVLKQQLLFIEGQIKAREEILNYTGPAETPKVDSDKHHS